MKMKTQVDMVNLNTKTFSFYDLLSNFGQFCAANLTCAILRKLVITPAVTQKRLMKQGIASLAITCQRLTSKG